MDRRIALFLIINVYCVYSSPYNLNQLIKRGEKLCGSRLSDMLFLVCNGKYNSKRAYNGNPNYWDNEEGVEDDVEKSDLIFPLFNRDYMKSLVPRKFRKSIGIVNECCYNSCSKDHLKLYCS